MRISQSSSDFDNAYLNYLNSSDHKDGNDLQIVKNYFSKIKFDRILDVATGAGHFTEAFNSDIKVAIDRSYNMVNTAKNRFGLNLGVVGISESLPFKDRSFDLVGCRIALHHFNIPVDFFGEVFRILNADGFFVLIDSIVDIDDAYLNVIEFLRDEGHIRSYTIREIIDLSCKWFRLEYFVNIYKKHDFYEWVMRLGADGEKIEKVRDAFINLPEKIRNELRLEINGGELLSYTDKKGLFIFKKL